MGGIGSGRRMHFGTKDTTDDHLSIDVRRWKRDGLLTPNQSFDWKWSRHGEAYASIQVRTEQDRMILTYRHQSGGENWKDESYPIYFDWTNCNLGGKRPWFICPVVECRRRVAILYGGSIFACRHCHQLAYASQHEEAYDRASRKANKIRERLGWKLGILNPKGWQKPKGMHWKTFLQLNKKHDAFVQVSLAGITEKLKLLDQSTDG